MLRPIYILAVLLSATGILVASVRGAEVLRKQFVGKTPPEIAAATNEWLGKSTPAELTAMKGRVVWLQFNF